MLSSFARFSPTTPSCAHARPPLPFPPVCSQPCGVTNGPWTDGDTSCHRFTRPAGVSGRVCVVAGAETSDRLSVRHVHLRAGEWICQLPEQRILHIFQLSCYQRGILDARLRPACQTALNVSHSNLCLISVRIAGAACMHLYCAFRPLYDEELPVPLMVSEWYRDPVAMLKAKPSFLSFNDPQV